MITPFPTIDRRSRIGIHGLLGPITKNPHSHKGAWGRLIRWQLKEVGYEHVEVVTPAETASLADHYDVIVIEPGMEFKGTINFFGGLKDQDLTYLERLVAFPGSIYAEGQPCPDYATALRKRWEAWWPDDRKERLAAAWERRRPYIPHFTHVRNGSSWVVGDSHALSAWRPGHLVQRHDGLTLHGALKRGLRTLWPEVPTDCLVLYLGNIDLRHHLCRQEDPYDATVELVEAYVNQVRALSVPNVTLVEPLFIEPETRKLPKSGFYKGEPFAGLRTDRAYLRDLKADLLRRACARYGWELQGHPEAYLQRLMERCLRTGELVTGPLDEAVMERPQSVHLSPAHYRHDLDTGRPRW